MSKKIELFGHDNCPACKLLKKYFEDNNIVFDYIDVFKDQCYAVDNDVRGVPHVIIGGVPFVAPTLQQVKNVLEF